MLLSLIGQQSHYSLRSSASKKAIERVRGPLKGVHFTTPSCPANEIWFYDRQSPYYEFTNFYARPVRINKKEWPTTEHYFQSQKFIGTPFEEHIRKLSTPREAFQFSKEPQVQRWRRSDWNQVKDDIMKLALLEKFEQHSDLRRKLVATGDKRLVEHTSNDSYWGDGGDGKGSNMLGKLLMDVREKMKSRHSDRRSTSGLRRSNSLGSLGPMSNYHGTSTFMSSSLDKAKYVASPSFRRKKLTLSTPKQRWK